MSEVRKAYLAGTLDADEMNRAGGTLHIAVLGTCIRWMAYFLE
jgi:hypothetical protein